MMAVPVSASPQMRVSASVYDSSPVKLTSSSSTRRTAPMIVLLASVNVGKMHHAAIANQVSCDYRDGLKRCPGTKEEMMIYKAPRPKMAVIASL